MILNDGLTVCGWRRSGVLRTLSEFRPVILAFTQGVALGWHWRTPSALLEVRTRLSWSISFVNI
jgi:hypothetical protein